MSRTTKALVCEVIVDQVRDQGTKAWSARIPQIEPRNCQVGQRSC